eukprot:1160947-Pelagomonas_calceolata.AAC.4
MSCEALINQSMFRLVKAEHEALQTKEVRRLHGACTQIQLHFKTTAATSRRRNARAPCQNA